MNDKHLDYLNSAATIREVRILIGNAEAKMRPEYMEKHGIRNSEYKERLLRAEMFMQEIMTELSASEKLLLSQYRAQTQLEAENRRLKEQLEAVQKADAE